MMKSCFRKGKLNILTGETWNVFPVSAFLLFVHFLNFFTMNMDLLHSKCERLFYSLKIKKKKKGRQIKECNVGKKHQPKYKCFHNMREKLLHTSRMNTRTLLNNHSVNTTLMICSASYQTRCLNCTSWWIPWHQHYFIISLLELTILMFGWSSFNHILLFFSFFFLVFWMLEECILNVKMFTYIFICEQLIKM